MSASSKVSSNESQVGQNRLDLLLALQDVDLDLADVRGLLERRPKAMEAQRIAVEQKRQALADVEDARKQMQADVGRKELEIQALKGRLDKLQVQRNQAKSNDEYSALTREIGEHKRRISETEERTLATLTDIDSQGERIEEIRKELAQEEERFNVVRDRVEGEIGKLREQEQAHEARREEVRSKLSQDILEQYDKVLTKVSDHALAGVDMDRDRRVCRGCNMQLTMQHINLLMADKDLVTCPTCNRILYLKT